LLKFIFATRRLKPTETQFGIPEKHQPQRFMDMVFRMLPPSFILARPLYQSPPLTDSPEQAK